MTEIYDTRVLEAQEITLAGQAKELVLIADSAKADTPENVAVLVEHIRRITAVVNGLETERKERDAPFKSALSRFKAAYDKLIDPLEIAKKKLGRMLTAYQNEQDRLAKAEAARLKKAEEDAALIEAARIQAIADQARAAGNTGTADAMEAAAEQVVQQAADAPGFAPAPVASVKGVMGATGFMKSVWKFRIVDAKLIPRSYLIPDEKLIGFMVRSKKGATDIPGVEVYEERSSQVRK